MRADEGFVTTASMAEVMAAVEQVNLEAPWTEIRAGLRPVLPRRRPMPPGCTDLPVRTYGGGLSAGLGLDLGPAMVFVGDDLLGVWGVGRDEAFDEAEANVRARVRARRRFELVSDTIADTPLLGFHSRDGWAASLLLMPEELVRVFREDSGLLLAPMRDLLLWLPLDAELAFAVWLLEEFAMEDPNALDVPVMALLDGRLSVPVAEDPGAGPGPTH
jgi:hypothetical protein